MTTEMAPLFAVTLRGYDKAEVDEYIESLQAWADDASARVDAATVEAAELQTEVERLRSRILELEGHVRSETPRTIGALGERITLILRHAEEGAADALSAARDEADATVQRAEQQARELLESASAERRHAESERVTTAQELEGRIAAAEEEASRAASRITDEVTARAAARQAQVEDWAQRVIEQTQTEREQFLREFAAERARRQQELDALTTQRNEVLAGLSQLQESLHRTIDQLPADIADVADGTVVVDATETVVSDTAGPPSPSLDTEAETETEQEPEPGSPPTGVDTGDDLGG